MRHTKTVGIISDDPVSGITEIAEPVGVVAGITPVTNPTSTVIFKSLICIKTRNPIIFAFHPNAQQSSKAAAIVMDFALTSLTTDCQSCYKCIRKCPTKSISFQNGRATIIPEECVLCGRCYLTCPQNCKKIRDDTALAKTILHENKLVYASVAPSFLAAFPGCSFASFRKALLGLGFSEVEETAIGATIVKQKYDELCDDGKHDVIISTCCHSINLLIEKHYPQASKYLANVLSPMLAHAADIKRRHPEAKVIFFGPCISKKNEVEMYPGYDELALTFLELEAWLKEAGIVLPKDDSAVLLEESKARLFPIDGGILATMAKDNPDFTYLSIGGMEQAMQAIENILQGNVHHGVTSGIALRRLASESIRN